LGYSLYVSNATVVDASVSGPLNVSVQVWNTGVAPFYYDWPVQLGALASSNALVKTWTTTWKLSSLLPTQTSTLWIWSQTNHGLATGQYKLLLAVQNPLTNGVPLRFANAAQDAILPGWLTLGGFSVVSAPARPSLNGAISPTGFDLNVNNATPGIWTVEESSDFMEWIPFLETNTSTSQWSVTDGASAAARFYRVVGSQ
jgi:hypothetical protein